MPKREADAIDRQIGRNLHQYRKKQRLSRGALGRFMKTPISAEAMKGYEDGTTRIPSAALVELAWLLGLKTSDLLAGVASLLPKSRPADLHQAAAVANVTRAMALELAERMKT